MQEGKVVVKRWLHLWGIVSVLVGVTSATSHFLVFWLGIRTGSVSHRVVGDQEGQPFAFLAGSSLTGDGLAWDQISKAIGKGVETWFVAGSSPCEWEPFQSRSPDAKTTIIGISAYDLNEYFLCDFRSNVVPLGQAIRDLKQSGCSWAFAKRSLSQYPLKLVRILFPTVGRSQGVLEGMREQFRLLARPWVKMESDVGPTIPTWNGGAVEREKTEKITDWSPAKLLRRLSNLRNACQGRHTFDGPKRLAFLRMLRHAQRQGRVIVVVLPVSPAYQRQFLTPETVQHFHDALTEVGHAVSEAVWVRIDQLPQLNSDAYFWDAVHMNTFGKQIATDVFLGRLRDLAMQP